MADTHEMHSNKRAPREMQRGLVPAGAPSAIAGMQPLRGAGHAATGMRPQFVLHALRRWWMLAVPASLLMAGSAGAAAWLLFVPKYEATAWFRMEQKAPFLAFQNRDEDRSKVFFQTEVEMIRSPLVLGPVFKRPEIGQLPEFVEVEDKLDWLAKRILVNSVGQSELFTIRFVGQRPGNAAKIVNAVADAYFKLRNQNESERIQRVLDLLEREKERRSQEVFRLREGLREMAKQVTGRDPYAAKADNDTITKSPLAELQMRLITAQVERTVLEARIKAMEGELLLAGISEASGGEVPAAPQDGSLTGQEMAYRNVMVDKAIAENVEMQKAAAVLSAKQARLAETETVLARGKEDPNYKRLEAEIVRDRQAFESIRSELRPRIEKEVGLSLQSRRSDTEAMVVAKQREELSHMRADVRAREILEQTLREEYEKGLKEVKQTSGETLELQFKRDELARAEKVFELIAQRTLEIQTERGAPARVSLLTLANEPTTMMVSPLRNVGIALLAGLLCPLALAIAWERLAKRVGDTRDIEQQSQVVVLGEIASLPSRARLANHETPRLREGLRLFEESIDSLRTTLMLSDNFRGRSVLAVTSAVKHEGKTSVAVQLSISLARATGQRVLLIDGDMRSSDIHRVFDIPRCPGLADILHGECSAGDAIVTSYSDSVHVLPGGKLAASPHRLLGDGKWNTLLATLKAQYAYVIIDTPPTLAASEAMMLAEAADATLVCAMRDVSRIDQVREVCERLVAAGARPVGTVLNGVPTRSYAYHYGTYTTTAL